MTFYAMSSQLLRLYCVKSGYGNQVGDEPFVLYNNGKGIDVSLDELQACWHVNGKSKMVSSLFWRSEYLKLSVTEMILIK